MTSPSSLIQRLARPDLLDMIPYQSARRIGGQGDIWLNANELPFSNHDCAYNRYPQFQPEQLIKQYAAYSKVDSEQVLATRGADEAIELLIRTFCIPEQGTITICPPTYGMYAISAKTCQINVNTVALTTDFQLDAQLTDKLGNSSLLFLCNPNNPTGSTLTPEFIETVIAQLSNQCIVVVDEAYIEFSSSLSVSHLLKRYNNLVILRTLSKAFGLAGLRCGFLLANKDIIELTKKVIAPYPIASVVADIATQALSNDGVLKMREQVAQLTALAQQFCQDITPLFGVKQVYPSGGNFILVKFNDASWFDKLHAVGIVVRNQDQVPTLSNCVRFSIGTASEMQRLTEQLILISSALTAEK